MPFGLPLRPTKLRDANSSTIDLSDRILQNVQQAQKKAQPGVQARQKGSSIANSHSGHNSAARYLQIANERHIGLHLRLKYSRNK